MTKCLIVLSKWTAKLLMCSHISACASLTWDLAKKCALRELAQACMSARRLFTLVKSPFHLHWPSVTSLVFPLKRPGTGPLLVMGNLPLLSHWTLPQSIIQTHIAANSDLNFNFLMNKWRLPLTVTGNVSFFPFLCGLTESCLHIQMFAAIELTDIKCGQAGIVGSDLSLWWVIVAGDLHSIVSVILAWLFL